MECLSSEQGMCSNRGDRDVERTQSTHAAAWISDVEGGLTFDGVKLTPLPALKVFGARQ